MSFEVGQHCTISRDGVTRETVVLIEDLGDDLFYGATHQPEH